MWSPEKRDSRCRGIRENSDPSPQSRPDFSRSQLRASAQSGLGRPALKEKSKRDGPRRRSCQRRGTATVETALVLPLLLLFFFGLFEYGQYLAVQQVIENAARSGARYAVVNTSTATTAQVQSYVSGKLSTVNNWISPTISVYQADPVTGNNLGPWTSAGFGKSIAVQIRGTYSPYCAAFVNLPAQLTVQTQAIMTSEAN